MGIEAWEAAGKAFEDGSIESCGNATMRAHLLALSNQQIYNDSIQHRDVIRAITLNHILLQRHINDLDRQNTKTQRWVIALAVASLIGTAVQVYYTINPNTFTPTAKQQPAHAAPSK